MLNFIQQTVNYLCLILISLYILTFDVLDLELGFISLFDMEFNFLAMKQNFTFIKLSNNEYSIKINIKVKSNKSNNTKIGRSLFK